MNYSGSSILIHFYDPLLSYESILGPVFVDQFDSLSKWPKELFLINWIQLDQSLFWLNGSKSMCSHLSGSERFLNIKLDQNADTPIHDLKWPVTIIINHFISESWILIACSSLKIPRKNNFKLSTKFLGWSNRGFCTSGRLVRSYQDWNIWLKGRVLFSFKFQLFVHIYINYVNNLNILFILI